MTVPKDGRCRPLPPTGCLRCLSSAEVEQGHLACPLGRASLARFGGSSRLAGEAVELGFGVFDVEECCICAAVSFGGGLGGCGLG